MTHAAVLVNIGPLPDLIENGYIDEREGMPTKASLEGRQLLEDSGPLMDLMEPYNENTSVPRYRDYLTRERKAREIMSVSRAWEKHQPTLEVRFIEPVRPRDRVADPSALSDGEWQRIVKEYEAETEAVADLYTDQEVADAYNTYWSREDTGGDRLYVADDEPGGETKIYRWSTYNPQSKWDYWQVIEDTLTLKDGSKATVARKGDIDWAAMHGEENSDGALTFALLDEQRGWFERGHLGWWGMSWDHKDDFGEQYRKVVESWSDDDVVVMCDYHI